MTPVVNEIQTRTVCVVEPSGANQHGARKRVEHMTTVTTPKSGWFDDDDDMAWEGSTLLRENAKFKYAWLLESIVGTVRCSRSSYIKVD